MRKNLANYYNTISNPGKNIDQSNSVNSVAKKVFSVFEAAEDHLMNNKNALKKNLSAYASKIVKRLG